MDGTLLPALACATGVYAIWRLFFKKSYYAYIPGPPKKSWLKGKSHIKLCSLVLSFCSRKLSFLLKSLKTPPFICLWCGLLGYFNDVFGEDGWDFHRQLVKNYGSVIRIPMLFGVSRVEAQFRVLINTEESNNRADNTRKINFMLRTLLLCITSLWKINTFMIRRMRVIRA